ncbi:fimbrial protein [Comamonas composti]|uniref:fimbrial protein n=1 Tax=Comamonas composti TaxID=408558 RepID=UPI0003FB0A99|nr:fimbrial protein [Comamonas composti]
MKSHLSKAIYFSMLIAMGSASAQTTNTGNIYMTGRIFSSTCQVEINGSSSPNATIEMGTYPTSAFPSSGTIVGGGGKDGKIMFDLSRCPMDKDWVHLKLDAAMKSGSTDIVRLDNDTSSSTAKNIGIYIYDSNDMSQPLNLIVTHKYPIDASNRVDIDLVAKYVSTDDAVEPGEANSTVNYIISYD